MAYRLLKAVFGPVLRVLWRIRVEGAEAVPAEGPLILASNHNSFIDSIFLPLVLQRRVTFVAKAEYFEARRTAWFFHAMGQIPIKRGGGEDSARALQSALEVLDGGGVFAIYPEGTRSPDGRLYKGHTGVARLALDTGAPVIAVAQAGTAGVQPIGARVPRPFKQVTLRLSPPLRFDRYRDRPDPLVLRQVTDEIMYEIAQMSGQTYVHEYAPKRELTPAPPPAVVRTPSAA